MTEGLSKTLEDLAKRSELAIVVGFSDLVVDLGKVRLLPPNCEVSTQGAPIDALLVPIDGRLKLRQQASAGAPRELGYLPKLQALALRELIHGKPHGCTAITESNSRVLYIPKDAFLALLLKQSDVLHYLKLITGSPGLRGFKEFLVEKGLDQRKVVSLFRSIQDTEETLEIGGSIDFSSRGLIFLTSGEIALEDSSRTPPAWTMALGAGSWCGGEGLVSSRAVSYRAKALARTRIHSAPFGKIGPLLNEFRLIEVVREDPWVVRDGAKSADWGAAPLSSLPGERLTAQETQWMPPSWSSEKLQYARSDAESFSASLSNICLLLGTRMNLSTVETILALDRRVTPLRAAELLDTCGLHTRAFKLKLEFLDRQFFPALAFLGPRMVVLLHADRKKKRAIFHDPAKGLVSASYQELAELWKGSVLEVSRKLEDGGDSEQATFRSRVREKFSSGFLLSHVWRYREVMWNALALNFLGIAVGLSMPLLSQHVLDEVLSIGDSATLWSCIAGMILVTLSIALIDVAGVYSQSEFAIRYDQELSTNLYRHALSLSTENFSKNRTGDILNRIASIGFVRSFLSGSSLQALIALFSLSVYFVVLCHFSFRIAMFSLLILAVVSVGQFLFLGRIVEHVDNFFESDAKARSLLAEQIFSIIAVKSTGSEEVMRSRWEEAQLEVIQAIRNMNMSGNTLQILMELISGTAQIASVWVAATLAIQKSLTPGQVLAVSLYVMQMTIPIRKVPGMMMTFAYFQIATRRLQGLLSIPSEQGLGTNAETTHSFALRGKIRLEGVSFRYSDEEPWILNDITLTIYPKQVIALVGRSGCGKSTLANLIASNLKPTTGKIFFDDFDSQFLSLLSLRRQIGVVLQNSDLFTGSVMENIAYAYDTVDERALKAAATSASADFIEDLPGKFSYALGESGLGLSGGEKQRISIARTLFRDPRILILDEATSSLDSSTERTLQRNFLLDVYKDKTVLIVAHRFSTIRNADRILVMDEGRIVEEGNHSELLEKGGHYSRLFRTQIRSAEA